MEKGLVSVLTPLYNLESFVGRLLDSILQQSYPNVEMIVMNDGSTDNGVSIVESYRDRFEAKGYRLRVISQENQGLSSTIKNGLRQVNGEYLIWPDADDFYHSTEAFSEMVKVLSSSDESVGMVRCRVNMVKEDDLNTVVFVTGKNNKPLEDQRLFVDCLLGLNGYYYGTGAYMMKYQAYLNASKGFYTNRTNGQNLQLCLPVLYHYRCASLSDAYQTYLIRGNSHSHNARSYEKQMETIKTHYTTRLETLKNIKDMTEADFKRYSYMVMRNFMLDQYNLAYYHNNKDDMAMISKSLVEYGGIPLRLHIRRYLRELPIVTSLYRLLRGK